MDVFVHVVLDAGFLCPLNFFAVNCKCRKAQMVANALWQHRKREIFCHG